MALAARLGPRESRAVLLPSPGPRPTPGASQPPPPPSVRAALGGPPSRSHGVLESEPGPAAVHAAADLPVHGAGDGGEPGDGVAGDALRLLPHAVGRAGARGGAGGRALRPADPRHPEEHVWLDPGRGDGGSGERHLPDRPLLRHPAGGHRALHRAARDAAAAGGPRGRRGRAGGQRAGAVPLPPSQRLRQQLGPRPLARGSRPHQGGARQEQPPLGGRGQRPQEPGRPETRPGGDQHLGGREQQLQRAQTGRDRSRKVQN